jgi:hypothetical protein
MRSRHRDGFYRVKELCDKGSELPPREISRKNPIPKNRTAPGIETAAVPAIAQPTQGRIHVEAS